MLRACASWCWSGRRDSAVPSLNQGGVCRFVCAVEASLVGVVLIKARAWRFFAGSVDALGPSRSPVRTDVVCFRELARLRVDLRHLSCITPAICGEDAAYLQHSWCCCRLGPSSHGDARGGHKSLQGVAPTQHARRELCVGRVGPSVTRALASSPSPRRRAHPAEG